MRVFLTGATGAFGTAAVRGLLERRHDVRAVARTDAKAASLRALGAEPVRIDLFDADAVRRAVGGAQVVMHLATNVPPLPRMSMPRAWHTHNRLRAEATRVLVEAARTAGVSRFVKESVTFVYPDGGDRWIGEETPPAGDVTLLEPTLEGERTALGFADGGRTAVVLRFASFYGPTARYIDEALRVARWRMALAAGSPAGYLSAIHTDDVASAVVAAIDAPTGIYNVGDDEPLTKRDYVDAFAGAFGLPRLHVMPTWAARLASGRSSVVVTRSWRISNRKLREATGWAPRYRDAREGWAAVAASRKASRR
jgi:nucleoside-diphosphate-sugar epimerase